MSATVPYRVGLSTCHPNPVLIRPDLPVRVVDHNRRTLARQRRGEQGLLDAIQAAALVQAALIHRIRGLAIDHHVTLPSRIRVGMADLTSATDRRAEDGVVLVLGGLILSLGQVKEQVLKRVFESFSRLRIGDLVRHLLGERSSGRPTDTGPGCRVAPSDEILPYLG